jgi:hypothetical protein
MKSPAYVKFIDGFVRGWYSRAYKFQKQHSSWERFFRTQPFSFTESLPFRYLPEPYIGNPQCRELKVVLINLNPAGGGDGQDVFLPKKNFTTHAGWKRKSYYDFIQKVMDECSRYTAGRKPLLYPTYDWWKTNRVDWFNNTFGMSIGMSEMMGFELLPWHSKKFNHISHLLNDKEAWTNVFMPALELSKRIQTPQLCNGKASIIIARGGAIKDCLHRLTASTDGLGTVGRFTQGTAIGWDIVDYSWPRSKYRTYILCYSKGNFNMDLPNTPEFEDFCGSLLAGQVPLPNS